MKIGDDTILLQPSERAHYTNYNTVKYDESGCIAVEMVHYDESIWHVTQCNRNRAFVCEKEAGRPYVYCALQLIFRHKRGIK